MEKWEIEALHVEIIAIESFLGIKFVGTTLQEKQEFVSKHREERVKVSTKLMEADFEEMKGFLD